MKKQLLLLSTALFFIQPSYLNAQEQHKLNNERDKVLSYIVTDVLMNPRYYIFKKTDTLYLNDQLTNKKMFTAVPLYDFSFSTNPSSDNKASVNELNFMMDKMKNDTLPEKVSYHFLKHPFKIENNEKTVHFSKPIFLREFCYCIISVMTTHNQLTFLLSNEKGDWSLVKKIGGYYEY